MTVKQSFDQYKSYVGINNLPEGIENYFEDYIDDGKDTLIDRMYLSELFERFKIPENKRNEILASLYEVESDESLFFFSKFLVTDMCSARNRRDSDNYTEMIPACMGNYSEYYSFLLLLACVKPSIEMLENKGVPHNFFEKISLQPMANQFKKLIEQNNPKVSDFPWDMNFYTSSIFLLDRFYFIPVRFDDDLIMV